MLQQYPFFVAMNSLTMSRIKTVSILGCGWYGLALAERLRARSYAVKGSATSAQKTEILKNNGIEAFLINLNSPDAVEQSAFFTTDLLIITVPPKQVTESFDYLQLVDVLTSRIIQHGIKNILFISSTSVYGDANSTVTEIDVPEPTSESGKLLLMAEQKLMECPAFSTTVLRFGGLYGPGRDPGKFLAGKKMVANGLAPVNLIHLEDCLGLTLKIITSETFGCVFNACSPAHPSRKDFYTRAAIESKLDAPHFINECKSWKIVSSVKTGELLDYQFKFYC